MSLLVFGGGNSVFAVDQTDEVAIGDSEAKVVELLGEAQGKVRSGGVDIMYYERGTVEMKDGKVYRVKLVSEKAATERTAERLRREEARRQAAEEYRQQLIDEGTDEKVRKMVDPAYEELSAQQMVDYWDKFKGDYPDVPIDTATYQAAQEELRIEKAAAIKAAAAAKAAEKPPRPRVSGKKKKKMKRGGNWIWD